MNLIEITDINAPELDIFARITEPQLRTYFEDGSGVFLAETAGVIIDALNAGYEPVSMLAETARLEAEAKPVFEVLEKCCGKEKADNLPIYIADQKVMIDMTGHHLARGLWAAFKRKQELTVEELCNGSKRIAVLYDVVNPANVGAIIRSAAALGMDGVLLTHPSVDPLTRRVARVSMGTVFKIPWSKAALEDSQNTRLIDILHSYGFKTVAMALTDDSTSVDNDEIRANEKLAVILGTEGTGLPKDVIAASDYRVMIPMHLGVDSLNVAAASAISFWEIMK
jgi:tRNA G18 (ribose-2'-O)-methylase SpoU